MAITYTQLDAATQRQYVNNRVRDLESAYFQLSLRVNSPAPGDVISQADRDNLATLESSINTLHAEADALAA